MKRLLCIAAAALLCVGQGFGPKIIKGPMPNGGAASPPACYSAYPALPCPDYRFVSSDLAINAAVSSWTDRIHGIQYTMDDASNRPTNSALGVGFSGSNMQLTNLPGIKFDWAVADLDQCSNTFFIVIMPTTTDDNQYFIADDTGSANDYGYNLKGSVSSVQYNKYGVGQIVIADYPSISNRFDFIHQTPTNWLATYGATYTNGVLSRTPAHNWQLRLKNIGSIPTAGPYGFKGYIAEFAVWTNYAFSTIQISNLHHYATNTYGFAP